MFQQKNKQKETNFSIYFLIESFYDKISSRVLSLITITFL